jgi:NADP-dependent 3-hydroxy acid dehydrogenase YdfG
VKIMQRVALVAGASSGIGKANRDAGLPDEGWRVFGR